MPNPQERFIEHLLQEIDRLHSIISMLVPKTPPRVVFDPMESLNNKADLFSEDPIQVTQFYKEIGIGKEIDA